MHNYLPSRVADVIPVELLSSHAPDISVITSWLVSDDGYRHPSVREWLAFLAIHHAVFTTIYGLFIKANPGTPGRKDHLTAATSPNEMLAIANQLFILKSYGVEGNVLECGCFKGYSTCCLSFACRRLGYPLVVADSFAGLPLEPAEVGADQYYQAGDFAGSRAEVEQNLRAFGLVDSVQLVEGWFSQTLRDWNRPLALLWLDVDLESSAADVLKPCLPYLQPKGVIFSHEFTPEYIRNSKIIVPYGPANAVARFVENDDADYRAAFLWDCLAIIGRSDSVGLESYQLLDKLIQKIPQISDSLQEVFTP
jgi:predicted O-methyltransferase YrrM